jgi:hypothetical protein
VVVVDVSWLAFRLMASASSSAKDAAIVRPEMRRWVRLGHADCRAAVWSRPCGFRFPRRWRERRDGKESGRCGKG